jgi:hypothetical protein
MTGSNHRLRTHMNWSFQVVNGGTTVVWTLVGPGTGNFNVTKHIFGFSITAPGVLNGNVSSLPGVSR